MRHPDIYVVRVLDMGTRFSHILESPSVRDFFSLYSYETLMRQCLCEQTYLAGCDNVMDNIMLVMDAIVEENYPEKEADYVYTLYDIDAIGEAIEQLLEELFTLLSPRLGNRLTSYFLIKMDETTMTFGSLKKEDVLWSY